MSRPDVYDLKTFGPKPLPKARGWCSKCGESARVLKDSKPMCNVCAGVKRNIPNTSMGKAFVSAKKRRLK